MAEIVDNSAWLRTRSNAKARYPWHEWFDGKTRILTEGEDFLGKVASIQNAILVNAARHGVKVRTSKLDDKRVQVQALI